MKLPLGGSLLSQRTLAVAAFFTLAGYMAIAAYVPAAADDNSPAGRSTPAPIATGVIGAKAFDQPNFSLKSPDGQTFTPQSHGYPHPLNPLITLNTVSPGTIEESAQEYQILGSDTHPVAATHAAEIIPPASLVPATASTYADFIASYPTLTGADLGASADPDRDGLSNLLEYAFGTSPIQSQRHADLAAMTTGGGSFKLSLVHRRSKNAAVTFSYEGSADLVTWSPATPLVIVTDTDADGDNLTEVATATLTVSGTEPRQFLRVKVDAP